MADLWRRRRFRFLLNLIDHLPRNSAYGDALAQDDELAVEAAERPDDTGPSLAEWSPEVALLSDLVDVLLLLRSEVWKLAGQKTAPPYRPVPRPLTAADRLAAERRERVRDDLRRLLPEG